MMKKNIWFWILFIISFNTVAQETSNKEFTKWYIYSSINYVSMSFRTGYSLELGVEKFFDMDFSFSSSLNFVQSPYGIADNDFYNAIQWNTDGYYSFFGNEKKVNLRLGIGLSFVHGEENRLYFKSNNQEYYHFIVRNEIGANIIGSLSYKLSPKLITGFQLKLMQYHQEWDDVNLLGIYILYYPF